MTRILLTGANGQVGRELQRALQPLGEIIACDRNRLDLTQADQIRTIVREIKPAVIINAAAYTQVDLAEKAEESATLHAVNADAPGILAETAQQLDALLLHYSTDYVFDGEKSSAYCEDDATAPLGEYGRSKLAGETAIMASGCRHLIFRVAWIYGLHGRNFLRTMLRLAAEKKPLSVVNDQFGAPAWSAMIANASALALARYSGQQGLYHLAAADSASWYEFSLAIFAEAQQRGLLEEIPKVTAIPSSAYPTPARRPANSRLDSSRLLADFNLRQPGWRRQLSLCLDTATNI